MANGEFYYSAKGDRIPLRRSTRSIAVAFRDPVPPKDLEALIRGDDRLAKFITSPELTNRRLVLYRRSEAATASLESFIERLLRSPEVAHVCHVFYRNESPIVITDEFITAFKPEVTRAQIDSLNNTHGVEIAQVIDFAPNTYVLRVRKPGVNGALDTANAYYETGLVLYSEPNYVQLHVPAFTPNDPLFPQQWHLPRIQTEQAWDITRGDLSVLISVIDTGIDIDHEDLAAPNRMVAPLDAVSGSNNPRPLPGENHGTSVTGVAAALANNGTGVAGAAPECRIIPIRLLGAGATVTSEAQALRHAVDNGAAVINNSWGPDTTGGPAPLPGLVGAALDHALANGRGGLGTVVLFAAHNFNIDISAPATFNGYAADDRVIAVAALNDQDVRSGYSNFGIAVDICAPTNGSSSAGIAPPFPADGSTLQIFTTDVTGAAGYNPPPLASPPDPAGAAVNYTGTFGGTSSASPLTAGVVALMLSVAPDLTRDQVVFILEATADKVDFANTNPVGQYQPNGHSQFYGFGRVNAFEAVKGARSSVEERDFVHSVQVVLRRTSGDRFVATKVIQTIDARRRQEETATDIFIRGGPDGFLRAEMAGAFDEVEVDA